MSELNPDFRDDDHPDLSDRKAVLDWLEDASVSNEERARRADVIERAGSAKVDDGLAAAISKARGEGAPAETHDDSRGESKPRASEARSTPKRNQPR